MRTEPAIYAVDAPEVQSAVERAIAYGIDVTLLQAMLRRTPTERLDILQSMLDFTSQARAARETRHGEDLIELEALLELRRQSEGTGADGGTL